MDCQRDPSCCSLLIFLTFWDSVCQVYQADKKRPGLLQAGIYGVHPAYRQAGASFVVAAYIKYASLLRISGALHLGIFDRPAGVFF